MHAKIANVAFRPVHLNLLNTLCMLRLFREILTAACMFAKQKSPSSKERMGFSVKPVHKLGNSATRHVRAGGFAPHSLERFAFFTTFVLTSFLSVRNQKTFRIILWQSERDTRTHKSLIL
jgi:hypothetical protein